MRVLQLSPYPIQPRIHGGQRRVGALLDAYRGNGFDCRMIEVYSPLQYPLANRRNLAPLSKASRDKIGEAGYLSDLAGGTILLEDAQARSWFVQQWREFRPDIVQLEHPFFWPTVRAVLESSKVPRARVFYSSHNLEWAMKEWLYHQVLPPAEAVRASEEVKERELELVRAADLVIAVSPKDEQSFLAAGARQTLVVRNGSDPRTPKGKYLLRWRERLAQWRVERHALFVSSNHLPNSIGFTEMIGSHLDFLPPESAILAVGGVTRLLRQDSQYRTPLAESRLRLLPEDLSDDDLTALLSTARAILLPITEGGGTNLKTVEALLTGRPIVATPFAFRGYESFAHYPHIHLGQDSLAFRLALQRRMLAGDEVSRAPTPELLELTWARLGERFIAGVRSLLLETPEFCKEAS